VQTNNAASNVQRSSNMQRAAKIFAAYRVTLRCKFRQ
jgi:hypothetical protein